MTKTAQAPEPGAIRLTEGHNPFRTERRPVPGHNGIEDRVYNPNDLLAELAARSEDRQDLLITDPVDANMSWIPTSEIDGVKGHFRLAPENVSRGVLHDYMQEHGDINFEWGSPAHRSICRMMETTPERYRKFGNGAEGRFLREFREWFANPREDNKGIIVRTESDALGKRMVEGFVPGNFNTLDEFSIVATVMEQLDSSKQFVNGVNVLHDSHRKTSSFRIIFGDPVITPGDHTFLDDNDETFCMLDIRYSPIGYTSFDAQLALWRLLCRNGAMRRDLEFLHVKWGQHYRENEDSSHRRLFDRTAEVVSRVDQFAPMIGAACRGLPGLALGEEPEEIIGALNRMHLLPKKHHDLALARLESRVDGVVRTEWDMLNLLTRSAHDLSSISERQTGEGRALQMAMQPEAFSGIVQAGFDASLARNDLREISGKH